MGNIKLAETENIEKLRLCAWPCFYGYASTGDSGSWSVDIEMNIRPSSSTGVIFALVSNDTVPLSIAVVTQGEDEAVSPCLRILTQKRQSKGFNLGTL